MKKSAVEWYEKEINYLFEKFESKEISKASFIIRKHNLFYQAIAKEKEQSESICINVIEIILDKLENGQEINSKEIFEKCYNETFKSE